MPKKQPSKEASKAGASLAKIRWTPEARAAWSLKLRMEGNIGENLKKLHGEDYYKEMAKRSWEVRRARMQPVDKVIKNGKN